MEALVLRVGPRHGRGVYHRRFDGAAMTIGRALHNDLIVSDPYLGATQFRLLHADGTLVLEILDRTNPVAVNGAVRDEAVLAIAPGDEIAVGQSVFSVLPEDSPVPRTRPMSTTLWARLGAWRPVVAVVMLLLTLLVALYVDYLDTVETIEWGELLTGPVFLGLLIVGWAALWAVVGRVLRHQPQFFSQLFVSALITLLTMQTTLGAAHLSYAVGFARAVDIADWSASALFSFALLYFNLRFATSLRRPAITAALSVALLLALLYGFEKAGEEEFIPYPVAEPLLRAPFLKLRDGLSFDAYEQRLSELFLELREEQ